MTKIYINWCNLYIPIVTLSAQDNVLEELKTGFKTTINRNEYQSEPTLKTRNRYLDYLIDPSLWSTSKK